MSRGASPSVTSGCFTFLCQPAVNPISICTVSRGRSCMPVEDNALYTEGFSWSPRRERDWVCVHLFVMILSLCTHAYTVRPFLWPVPHFPALAPRHYGDLSSMADRLVPWRFWLMVQLIHLWISVLFIYLLIELLLSLPFEFEDKKGEKERWLHSFPSACSGRFIVHHSGHHYGECLPLPLHLVRRWLVALDGAAIHRSSKVLLAAYLSEQALDPLWFLFSPAPECFQSPPPPYVAT